MTPKVFLKIERELSSKVKEIEQAIDAARESAESCPAPQNLRPATATDIVVGAVIWYPHWDECRWAIVEEVLNPRSEFKAYTYLGCRYGLSKAFVEVEE